MPSHTPTTSFYRPILRDAFHATVTKKSLWVFGFFAGLVHGGTMGDVLFRTFHTIQTGGDFLLRVVSGSVASLEEFGTFIHLLASLGSQSSTLLLFGCVFGSALLLLFACFADAYLFSGLSTLARRTTVFKNALWLILPFLTTHIFTRVFQGILMLISTLPLVLYLSETTFANAFLFFGVFLVFYPLTAGLHATSLMVRAHLVKTHEGLGHSVSVALHILRRHWLSVLELGLISFVIITLFWSLFFLLPVLLLFPSISLALTDLPNSTLSFNHLLFGSISLVLLFVFSLSVTTVFHARLWIRFYEETQKDVRSSLLPKLERIWANLFSV